MTRRHEPVWWADDASYPRSAWPLWVSTAVVAAALLLLLAPLVTP